MNKLLRLLLALLLVTVLALGIVACGEEDTAPVTDDTDQTDTTNEPEHTHKWVAATCKAPKTCKTCGETEGKALAHTEKTVEAVPATCTEDGLTEGKVCSVCNTVIKAQEVVPAGHTWVDADCDTPKTCSVCGATEGEALGHDWADATTEAPKTCKVCGATEGDPLPPAVCEHDWSDADCDTPKTCSKCGATEGEALGHDWADAD